MSQQMFTVAGLVTLGLVAMGWPIGLVVEAMVREAGKSLIARKVPHDYAPGLALVSTISMAIGAILFSNGLLKWQLINLGITMP